LRVHDQNIWNGDPAPIGGNSLMLSTYRSVAWVTIVASSAPRGIPAAHPISGYLPLPLALFRTSSVTCLKIVSFKQADTNPTRLHLVVSFLGVCCAQAIVIAKWLPAAIKQIRGCDPMFETADRIA
jgi:hypothetical protein